MNNTNIMLFFVASWVLIVTPGPDMLYVITRGIAQGKIAGMLSALGVTFGLFVHTALAALGLAVLLQTSAIAFAVVKYAGAAYLIYLGIKAFKDTSSFRLEAKHEPVSYGTLFLQGMLSNLLNPKIAMFFLAFLPQFVNSERGNVSIQMLALGLTFAFFGLIFLSIVGYFSGRIGHWLLSRANIASNIRWLTGSVLMGLGVRLALVKQRS